MQYSENLINNQAVETAERRFAVTFGKKMNQPSGTWTDRRGLPWPELASILTDHKEGPKDGPCVVPATLRQPKRNQEHAEEIAVLFLDSDCGHTLAEIELEVRAHCLAAVIYSTHSHMTTTTTLKREEFEKRGLSAEQYLIQVKGYLPRVATGAKVLQGDGDEVILEHKPCPKYRVVLRLDRPWRASNYPDQDQAIEAWRERYKAVAHYLGLVTDPSGADPNRLFFLPRHEPGAPFETLVIEGADLRIGDLPKIPEDHSSVTEPQKPATRKETATGDDPDVIGAFNREFTVEGMLEKHGYRKIGHKYLAPTSSTGEAGVSIKEGRAFSHQFERPAIFRRLEALTRRLQRLLYP
jgi:hypothetical protein